MESILYKKSRSLLHSYSGLKQRESLPAQPLHFSWPLADRIDYQQGALQKKPVTALS